MAEGADGADGAEVDETLDEVEVEKPELEVLETQPGQSLPRELLGEPVGESLETGMHDAAELDVDQEAPTYNSDLKQDLAPLLDRAKVGTEHALNRMLQQKYQASAEDDV